jgi:hypothetical protein
VSALIRVISRRVAATVKLRLWKLRDPHDAIPPHRMSLVMYYKNMLASVPTLLPRFMPDFLLLFDH